MTNILQCTSREIEHGADYTGYIVVTGSRERVRPSNCAVMRHVASEGGEDNEPSSPEIMTSSSSDE